MRRLPSGFGRPTPPDGNCRLGDSLTAEQRTLTPRVQVRILVPQPGLEAPRAVRPTEGAVVILACAHQR